MRFLIYTNHLGRKSVNGTAASIMTSDLVSFLLSKGHDVIVVANKDIVEEDIKCPYIPIGGGDLLRPYKVSKIIKDFKPDIVYSFFKPLTTVLSLSTFFGKHACYVGSIHNTTNYSKYGKLQYMPYRILIKFLFERLDYIACPSEAVVKDLKRTYFIEEKKLHVVHNFIDYEKIENMAEEEVEIPENYIIGVGKLEEQKNFKSLLRIFSIVAKEFPELWLVLVGDGSQREELRRLAEELQISHRVLFTGYQYNPWKYMKRAKLFVLTSLYEAGPQVMLEAMYLKIPVISFDIPSVVEQSLGGSCAILVPAYDEAKMAQTIIKALKGEYDLASLVERAHRRSLDFSVENFVNTLTRLCGCQ